MKAVAYGIAGVKAPAGGEAAALRAQLLWALVMMSFWMVVMAGWIIGSPVVVIVGLASAFAIGMTSPVCRCVIGRVEP